VLYSIKDLEILTGIKAHTIRIWEKRYGLVAPSRTQTNIRLYSDEDMRLLLNVSLLNKNGFKISTIKCMSTEEVHQNVLLLDNSQATNDLHINKLIVAMMSFDEKQFEKVLDECISIYSFDYIIDSIMLAFFRKIGIQWQVGEISPAKEHFVSNIFRQKVITATEKISLTNEEAKTFLLFLPQGETHEIALLFIRYILRKLGHQVVYLGQNVPISSLQEVLNSKSVDYLITSISAPISEDAFLTFIDEINQLKSIKLTMIGGNLNEQQRSNLSSSFKFFNSIERINAFLHTI